MLHVKGSLPALQLSRQMRSGCSTIPPVIAYGPQLSQPYRLGLCRCGVLDRLRLCLMTYGTVADGSQLAGAGLRLEWPQQTLSQLPQGHGTEMSAIYL